MTEDTKPPTVPTCIGFPADVRDRLDAFARAVGRSRSDTVTRAVQFFIDSHSVPAEPPPDPEPRP